MLPYITMNIEAEFTAQALIAFWGHWNKTNLYKNPDKNNAEKK